MPKKDQPFADAIATFLSTIRPWDRRSETCYPPKMSGGDSSRSGSGSLHEWFVKMVDQFCDGDPAVWALELNLAVFAHFRWNGNQLIYANIQALRTTRELADYYCEESVGATYLRLDFDYETLGALFSHPLAHIHVGESKSLRFALDGGDNGNVIVDFLEWLYRTYAHRQWLHWVEREWAKEFESSAGEGDVNPLPDILDASRTNQFHILKDHEHQIQRIKRMLRRRKDEMFDLHMNGSDRVILEYPLAR